MNNLLLLGLGGAAGLGWWLTRDRTFVATPGQWYWYEGRIWPALTEAERANLEGELVEGGVTYEFLGEGPRGTKLRYKYPAGTEGSEVKLGETSFDVFGKQFTVTKVTETTEA